MLAYVFWHRPAPGTDPAAYERALKHFHHALALPHGSRTLKLDRAPHDPQPAYYEDWYLVADWTQLGALNDRAVDTARHTAHDAAARHAASGAGGVYKLLTGTPPQAPFDATWLTKPRNVPYAQFLPTLAAPAVWQRQMVLGPAPELLLQGARDPRGTLVRAEPV